MISGIKRIGLVWAIALLTACSPTPPPADILAIEPAARRMQPQKDVALLYFLTTKDQFTGTVMLHVNGKLVLMGDLPGWFYAFCLPPGKHEIEYAGGGIFSIKKEFVIVKAGDIHIRDVRKNIFASLLLLPGSIDVEPIDIEVTRGLLPARRLGSSVFYAQSEYRCRTLSG